MQGGQWTYTDGSEVRGYTRGTDTCGKLGRYDTGGYLLETFEDDPVLNGSNSSSGRRVLKGAKKGKMALGGGKSGPWANQLAFDMWATAAGVPWDDTVSKYWIDDQTRAVFIDVTVYNPSLRIVSVVRLVVEITDTGQCIPTFLVNTMRQRHFFDPEDIQSWAEWGLILLIGLLTVRDAVCFVYTCRRLIDLLNDCRCAMYWRASGACFSIVCCCFLIVLCCFSAVFLSFHAVFVFKMMNFAETPMRWRQSWRQSMGRPRLKARRST